MTILEAVDAAIKKSLEPDQDTSLWAAFGNDDGWSISRDSFDTEGVGYMVFRKGRMVSHSWRTMGSDAELLLSILQKVIANR